MTALNAQIRNCFTAAATQTGFVASVPKIVSRVSYVTLITFSASIIASCSYADNKSLPKSQGEKQEGSSLSVEIRKPDIFKPLFEGDIAERAAALGEGPYKIGTPITGYASDYIKTYFEHYDHDLRFTQQLNFDEDICNFSKAALFSDQIDLSEFYWHHPTEEQSPLQKIDKDLYHLTDGSGLYIHFNYDDFAFSINDEPIRLVNSWLYLCQFGDNPEIKYSEHNDAIDIYTTIKINKGRCDYEYDTDTAPIFSRNYPGSTIGFFWSKDDLYIISVQLFDYGIYNTRSIERSSVAITTSKVNYESNGQMRGFAATCVYNGHKTN